MCLKMKSFLVVQIAHEISIIMSMAKGRFSNYLRWATSSWIPVPVGRVPWRTNILPTEFCKRAYEVQVIPCLQCWSMTHDTCVILNEEVLSLYHNSCVMSVINQLTSFSRLVFIVWAPFPFYVHGRNLPCRIWASRLTWCPICTWSRATAQFLAQQCLWRRSSDCISTISLHLLLLVKSSLSWRWSIYSPMEKNLLISAAGGIIALASKSKWNGVVVVVVVGYLPCLCFDLLAQRPTRRRCLSP